MELHGIVISRAEVARFCETHHIRRLAIFGSILTSRFRPDSDVDVLVEFDPVASPTYLDMAGIEQELSTILGRKADVRTANELSRYFRDQVAASSAVQYERE